MSTQIGIISDTHGILREEVIERLKDCDYIFHCGDFDNKSVIKELKALGHLIAVRGNNDYGRWTAKTPYSRYVTIGDVRFFMIHDQGDVPRDLKPVDVILFGHTHEFEQEVIDGVTWLNPGSCGKRRFRLGLSMVIMTITNGEFAIEKFDVDED